MPFCQNQGCGKTELKREEIEFDEVRKLVLCLECAADGRLIQLVPNKKIPVSYDISLTSKGGLRAELAVGEVTFGVEASPAQIQKLLKAHG